MENLSLQEENRILIRRLWESGYTANQINNLNIKGLPQSTIYDNCKKLEAGCFRRQDGSGRLSTLDEIDKIEIIRYLDTQDPYASCDDIAKHLLEETGTDVSSETIRRTLHEMNYEYITPKVSPLITPSQETRRMEWATANKLNDWSKTLFTDETTIWLKESKISRWKPIHDEYTIMIPKNVQKLNIWAGVSSKGLIHPYIFKENLTGEIYVEILETKLSEVKKMFWTTSSWNWQHDNDPKHTSKLAKSWFDSHRINVLDWPSSSPDLNPMENVWSWVKNQVNMLKPKSITDLKKEIELTWSHIPKYIIDNSISSMRNRCECVLQLNGKKIPF